jgi:hypothetical protein
MAVNHKKEREREREREREKEKEKETQHFVLSPISSRRVDLSFSFSHVPPRFFDNIRTSFCLLPKPPSSFFLSSMCPPNQTNPAPVISKETADS